MINLNKEKHQGAAAEEINFYNWVLKDKILDNLIGNGDITMSNHNVFAIWDPFELKSYICDSI